MRISRVVEGLLELQNRHGDIEVHIEVKETGGESFTEEVELIRPGRPRDRDRAMGTAVVAVIEG